MNTVILARLVFTLSGIYDLLLGLNFLLFPLFAFNLFNVTPPNHLAYVQFPALLLLIFAAMFFVIAKEPEKNTALIPYGIMLKLSYSSVVFGYWFLSEIPNMWKPFAIADLLFLAVFIWCYYRLRTTQRQSMA